MIAVEFARLFLGNRFAYGGDAGKAIRCQPNEWFTAVASHLEGGSAVGVYPMFYDSGQWFCRWGCVDFDIKSEGHEKFDYETEQEAHVAALNLVKVLEAFGIAGWIERTRSHGRHVWVFANQACVAADMRHALLVATDIAGVSQREVNPKSDGSNLTPDQLGNYVRLPYDAASEQRAERRVYNLASTNPDQFPFYGVKVFIDYAMENLTHTDVIRRVAALYRPPAPVLDMNAPDLDSFDGKVPKVVRHVILNGPNDGDRSKGLLYIAHECKKAGLSPKHALQLVMIADDAWGKYTGRRDREQRLMEIVERAWQ